MKEQLITFDTAKLAKEKGFDIKVETFYMGDSEDNFLHNAGKKDNWNNHKCIFNESELSGDYSAPTQSLLQKWLRDKHKISVAVFSFSQESWTVKVNTPSIFGVYFNVEQRHYREKGFCTYEEALEKGLKEALRLIKK